MGYAVTLNEYQKMAVLDDSPACLVNANVGSGKTTVLIEKLLYLHHEKAVSYDRMVVFTFTNKAADEIKGRLYAREPDLAEEDLPWFGTFHAVALALLKRELPVETLGFTKEFLVAAPEEELEMAEWLIMERGFQIKYKNRLKKRLEQAMAVRSGEKKVSRYQDDLFLLCDALRGEKVRQNKMSFYDLLYYAEKLLRMADASFSPEWIVADEVQDCDEMQLAFMDALKKEHARLFAVGDPNQVIYSWRGSAFHIFHTLRTRYQARELTLPINYRSSGCILDAARLFLQSGSRLEGVRGTGEKIVVKNHYNPFQEADYLADRIRALHGEGIPYREIAVFYRLQGQSEIFENVFRREGIPYEVSMKKTIGDLPVLHWFIRVLRCSVNGRDVAAAVAALCDRTYGAGLKEKQAAEFLRVMEEGALPEKKWERAAALYRKMRGFAGACEAGMAAADYFDYFFLKEFLHPTAASYEEDCEAVRRFLSVLEQELAARRTEGGGFLEKVQDFLNRSALYGVSIFEQEIDGQADCVKLMTLHASKGLEFSYVFLTGVNYGLIPLQTKDMEAEEEEQRLFFVGMTRAKDHLELSYYTSPEQFGGGRATPGPSRYIGMIPKALVTNEAAGETPKMDTAARLQEIKRQIMEARGVMNDLFPGAGDTAHDRFPGAGDTAHDPFPETGNTACGRFSAAEGAAHEMPVRVSHPKYGVGTVVREDADTIAVNFEDYGEKEFLRMFSELEEIVDMPPECL